MLSLLALLYCFYFLPPTFVISFMGITISILYVIFLFLFLFFYSLTAYLFRSFVHGILIGLFPIFYLTMRLNDLRNPIFFVLLAGIFVALEILLLQFTKPKPVDHKRSSSE